MQSVPWNSHHTKTHVQMSIARIAFQPLLITVGCLFMLVTIPKKEIFVPELSKFSRKSLMWIFCQNFFNVCRLSWRRSLILKMDCLASTTLCLARTRSVFRGELSLTSNKQCPFCQTWNHQTKMGGGVRRHYQLLEITLSRLSEMFFLNTICLCPCLCLCSPDLAWYSNYLFQICLQLDIFRWHRVPGFLFVEGHQIDTIKTYASVSRNNFLPR